MKRCNTQWVVVFALAAAVPVRAQPLSLSLREAVARALAQSPRLRASDEAKDLAEMHAIAADARYGIKANPSLTAGNDPVNNPAQTLGLTVSKPLPTGADLSVSATSFRYGENASLRDTGYTVALSQPLFRGFGAVMTAERALSRRGVESAKRTAEDARRQLIVTTAEAYFATIRQRHQVENAEHMLESARTLRVSSDARARVGLATELDVLRADLLAARAESALAQSREQFESALDSVKLIVGASLDTPLDVSDVDLSDEAMAAAGVGVDDALLAGPAEEVSARLMRAALDSRLDVREARDRVRDAEKSETIARWNLFPTTALNVTYTQRGIGSSIDLFAPLNGWRIGLSSSYSLSRADERAATGQALLAVKSANADALELEDRVRAEVRQAVRTFERSKSTVEIQEKAVGIADRQVRLAQIRYQQGVAGNFDVVDAENLLFQARAEFDAARAERALAGLNLRRVVGQLDPHTFLP